MRAVSEHMNVRFRVRMPVRMGDRDTAVGFGERGLAPEVPERARTRQSVPWVGLAEDTGADASLVRPQQFMLRSARRRPCASPSRPP